LHRSMTGYGSYQSQDKVCAQSWEIRSVNSKHLSLRWRLPGFLQSQEPVWEQKLREFAARGRVEIGLELQLLHTDLVPVQLDQARAGAMLLRLQELATEQGLDFSPDLNRLLNIPALWQDQGTGPGEDLEQTLLAGLQKALQDWDESRQKEGRVLSRDLMQRIQGLQGWLQELRSATQDLAQDKLQLLRQRLEQAVVQAGFALEEERLTQELALLADKVDVSEELTRLQSHLDELQEMLGSESGGGRRLDFMLQECFREINTCGNKAQDSRVSRLVVDFKTELEKCREQVQNLE
ncbi:MAG: YicC/YloC family endoribonuclease, partial [Desulfohalobiaceae bacterium]